MILGDVTLVLDGIGFPESPRWYDGRLWLVDLFAGKVLATDLDGRTDVVAEIDDDASGLGFLPDGTPIVVGMRKRRIWRLESGGPVIHADLADCPAEWLNDMVVDDRGRAYVDGIAPDTDERGSTGKDFIFVVEPSGEWRIAASGVRSPNGLVIAPDRRTLIHASPLRRILFAWTIAPDGRLVDERHYAETHRWTADGICLDAEGAIWVGGLSKLHFVRIVPPGEVDQIIDAEGRWAVACMLGGPDRRSLFMLSAEVDEFPIEHPERIKGRVDVARVDVPGAGWP
jgi:sugar lactone lactonase YvrE